MVEKTAICSLSTSSVWTDSEFGNSIQSGATPGKKYRTVSGNLKASILDNSDPAKAFKEAYDEGVITKQEYQRLLKGQSVDPTK